MNSTIAHIYLYVSNLPESYKFYKSLLEYLNYSVLTNEPWGAAFIKDGTSIWLEQTPDDGLDLNFHRRRTGLNHLAFKVDSKQDVDKFRDEFLTESGAKILYNTPRPFPEYEKDYYAVYFEDPDGLKLEVTYHP